MLKIIGFFFKFTFLTVLILVLGQMIVIGGNTLSDHVKVALKIAEKDGGIAEFQKKATDLIKTANVNAPSFTENSPSGRTPSSEQSANDATATLKKVQEIKAQEKAALSELLKDP
jgi:hypothetical protein